MNALIGENRIDEALELFNGSMRGKDLREFESFTLATIMNALFKSGKSGIAKAVWVLNQTEDGSQRIVFNTMINGLCMGGQADTAMIYCSERGFLPNVVTMNSLIQGFASLGRWDDVEKVYARMPWRVKPNSYTFHVLMDAMSKFDRKSPEEDPIKGLICPEGADLVDSRYRQKGYPTESILKIMSDANAEFFAYNSLMKRYCLDGRMVEAQHVFNYLVKNGFHLNISSYNILINGYCKRLEFQEAMKLYREIPQLGLKPNTDTYHSLLKGLLVDGRCAEAGEIFRDMIKSGKSKSPQNMLLYSSLLNTGGKVEEDSNHLWYKWMKPDFGHEEILNEVEKLLLGMLARSGEKLTNKDVIAREEFECFRRRAEARLGWKIC